MEVNNFNHRHNVKTSFIPVYILTINIYIFARHFIQIFTNHLFSGPPPGPGVGWIYFVNGLVYSATILCGCLMAALIKKRAWLTIVHGALSTAIAMSMYVSMYYQPLGEYIYNTILGLAVGAILGGTGSIITLAIVFLYKKYQ